MKKYKTILILFLIIFVLIEISGPAGAETTQFIMLDEIEPGMKGISKTVFEGVEIETFTVQVKDILRDDMDNDLILIESEDEKIKEIGGIAAGMSGSPVYFDGKLAGAIAYSWNNIDDNYAMITPIDRMKKLMDEPTEDKNNGLEFQKGVEPNLSNIYSPLLVSGLRGRALERLKEDLSSFEIRKGTAGQGNMDNLDIDQQTLEPGSAIAVQLVRGDINVSSIGTLTYKEDNKFTAFGHSFANKGVVDYLFSKAYINTIVSSPDYPFKVGYPLDVLQGTINVDRRAGIAGKTNKYPRIIPLHINVTDQDRNIEKKVRVQIVNEEDILLSLALSTALQAVDNTIDRIGRGTAEVNLEVLGTEIPGYKISRKNMFYSTQDIAARTLIEFQELLDILAKNPFQKVNIYGLNLNIDITSEDQHALLQEAEILNEDVKPGDTMQIKLTLLPYRGQQIEEVVEIEIPENFRQGRTRINILTGDDYFEISTMELDYEEEDLTTAEFQGFTELEPIIDELLERPKNNEIIIEGFADRRHPKYHEPDYPEAEPEQDENEFSPEFSGEENEKNNNNNNEEKEEVTELKITRETDYVLEGNLNLQINIEEENTEENNIEQ